MRLRLPPRHLRLVVPVTEPLAAPDTASGDNEVDRVLAPMIKAGRDIIGAGLDAMLDMAGAYDLDWDRVQLRSDIADLVVRRLHDDVIAVCTRDRIDRDVAARHIIYGHGRDAAVEAITNGIIQNVAEALLRYGCSGGLGDSRALHAAVREIVARDIPVLAP